MDLNGVENYAPWVNKNYPKLQKRHLVVESQHRKPEQKPPRKVLDRNTNYDRLRQRANSTIAHLNTSPMMLRKQLTDDASEELGNSP